MTDFVGMADMLNSISADTSNQDIRMINISELYDSADNFFSVENIFELAESILAQGRVKENLIVTPLSSGGYEIVSGHRRKAAVRLLLDEGENISEMLPCLVVNYDDHNAKMIDLIMMNITQRKISDADLYTSFLALNKIFQEQKEKGIKFGKLREKIAESLNVSPAQIGKLQNIENHAVSELKEAVQNGNICISTANKIAKLDEDEQLEIINSSELTELKSSDIRNPKTDKGKKVDTSINLEEDGEDEPSAEMIYEQKVDSNINFTEIKNFVSKYRAELIEALDTYSGMIDTAKERDIMRQFMSIISKI